METNEKRFLEAGDIIIVNHTGEKRTVTEVDYKKGTYTCSGSGITIELDLLLLRLGYIHNSVTISSKKTRDRIDQWKNLK